MDNKVNIAREQLKAHILWRMLNDFPSDCATRVENREECAILWRIISGLPDDKKSLYKKWKAIEYKCECIFCRDTKL